jgi:hypothetical protein
LWFGLCGGYVFIKDNQCTRNFGAREDLLFEMVVVKKEFFIYLFIL